MLRYKFPLIEDEITTVRFIIHGLRTHPDYAAARSALHIAMYDSIQKCLRALQNIPISTPSTTTTPVTQAASSSHVWCAFHNRYGTHTTDECYGLKRLVENRDRTAQVPGDSNKSGYKKPPMKPGSKPKTESHRRAHNADVPDNLETEQQDEHVPSEVNESSTFASYLVDSGCTPSFTPLPTPGLSPKNTSVRLPKNSTCPIIAEGATTLRTTSGNRIHLSKLCEVPTFKRPLLSVFDIIKSNNATVSFTAYGETISTQGPDTDSSTVLANLTVRNGLYFVDLSPERTPSANHVRKQNPIFRGLKKTKPLRPPGRIQRKTKNLTSTAVLPPPVKRQAAPEPQTIPCDQQHELPYPDSPPVPPSSLKTHDTACDWHLVMNHISHEKLKRMAQQSSDFNLPPPNENHQTRHHMPWMFCWPSSEKTLQRKNTQATTRTYAGN